MRANVIIKRVLDSHPETRSSDRELYIKVWEEFGFYMSESQKAKFRELPPSETIRRIRQKLQEQGKYPALETVRKHRKSKGMQMRQQMPSLKAHKIEPLLDQREVEHAKKTPVNQTSLI